MKFALVTTVYNEESNIRKFLSSYLKQTLHADEFVILDGGSTDNTVSILKEFSNTYPSLNLKIIVDEKCSKKFSKGAIAKGRNIAISNTLKSTDYIVVTDAGCLLDQKWLEEIVKPFDEGADLVCGYYSILVENDFDRKYSKIFLPKNDDFLPSSRSFAFKKECWKAVGGYPEETYTAEDTFFDLKLLDMKYKMHRAPKAIVYWKIAKDENDLRKKIFAYGYGEGMLHLYKLRYLFRLFSLIIPIYPLMHPQGLVLCYKLYFYQVLGYWAGLLNSFKK